MADSGKCMLENTHCIICSSKDASHLITVNDRLNISSQKFHLVQCPCGFIYLNPRPNIGDLTQYYLSDDYDPHRNKSNGIWDTLYHYVQQLSFRWKYRIIRSLKKSGGLLDIGGGNGEFAEFIHGKGWNVTLQDSMINSDRFKKPFTFVTELSEINSSSKFDVITLWHSLEHIHNIKYLFNSLNDLLKESGILLIAVPNINAPERVFYKENWVAYDAPRHLYHFNLDRLKELLRQNGYNIIQKYSLYQDMPYNVLLSMPNYSLLQIVKSSYVIFYSLSYTLCAGPELSSSLLIVCKKSL